MIKDLNQIINSPIFHRAQIQTFIDHILSHEKLMLFLIGSNYQTLLITFTSF